MSIAQAAQKTGSTEVDYDLELSRFASVRSTGQIERRATTWAGLTAEMKTPKEYSSKADMPLLKMAVRGQPQCEWLPAA